MWSELIAGVLWSFWVLHILMHGPLETLLNPISLDRLMCRVDSHLLGIVNTATMLCNICMWHFPITWVFLLKFHWLGIVPSKNRNRNKFLPSARRSSTSIYSYEVALAATLKCLPPWGCTSPLYIARFKIVWWVLQTKKDFMVVDKSCPFLSV